MSDPPRLLDPDSGAPPELRELLSAAPPPPPLDDAMRARLAAGIAKAGAGAAVGTSLATRALLAALALGGSVGVYRRFVRPASNPPPVRVSAPASLPLAAPGPAPSLVANPLVVPAPQPPAAQALASTEAPRPEVARSARTARAACTRDLTRETELLESAQRQLEASPRGALASLREHARAFPEGCAQLTLERELLWVRALQRSGDRDGARARVQRLLAGRLDALTRARAERLARELE